MLPALAPTPLGQSALLGLGLPLVPLLAGVPEPHATIRVSYQFWGRCATLRNRQDPKIHAVAMKSLILRHTGEKTAHRLRETLDSGR